MPDSVRPPSSLVRPDFGYLNRNDNALYILTAIGFLDVPT
jgi:hypothetical protein